MNILKFIMNSLIKQNFGGVSRLLNKTWHKKYKSLGTLCLYTYLYNTGYTNTFSTYTLYIHLYVTKRIIVIMTENNNSEYLQ